MLCPSQLAPTYTAPGVSDSSVTPTFVRDELLRCFEDANREFMTLLNVSVTDEQLEQQVKGFVEGVFSRCGVSYVDPTKEGIIAAISECKTNAEQSMGSRGADIIHAHYSEMMKLVDRLS